ncbi:hypothetical protein ZWY2020_020574 [Hordeum vulgare]|nr:hypothetical protein ZWY2020_020574 [Hordeum vulgare]
MRRSAASKAAKPLFAGVRHDHGVRRCQRPVVTHVSLPKATDREASRRAAGIASGLDLGRQLLLAKCATGRPSRDSSFAHFGLPQVVASQDWPEVTKYAGLERIVLCFALASILPTPLSAAISPHPPPPVCRLSAPEAPLSIRRHRAPSSKPSASGRRQRSRLRRGTAGADEDEEGADLHEALTKTRRLVECAMFASVAGLAYFLSNSSPSRITSAFFSIANTHLLIKMGIRSRRKTMVATVLLLFTLSGPVKALTYLLMHGVVGLSMGTMWRLETNWIASIIICAIIRAVGACGYVLVTSFLIRENIFQLITVNIHASLTYILAAAGVNTIPSMDAIYVIFGTLVLLNSGFFVFILHIIYTIFLTKLGIKPSLRLPRWLGKATSS